MKTKTQKTSVVSIGALEHSVKTLETQRNEVTPKAEQADKTYLVLNTSEKWLAFVPLGQQNPNFAIIYNCYSKITDNLPYLITQFNRPTAETAFSPRFFHQIHQYQHLEIRDFRAPK